MLEAGIDWRRRDGVSEARVDSLEVMGDRAAVTVSWLTSEGNWIPWSHVLELNGGRIVRIKDS